MIYYYHDFIIIRLAQFIMDVVEYSIYEIRNQMIIEKKKHYKRYIVLAKPLTTIWHIHRTVEFSKSSKIDAPTNIDKTTVNCSSDAYNKEHSILGVYIPSIYLYL